MSEIERLNAALEGRYRIARELGRGGMATVYLAEDLKHGRQVALKVLRQELTASIGAERFLREINIAAQLQHPNILTLIDSGRADGQLFFAMPYVEGESLRQRLTTQGALPVSDALRILQAIVDALAHAHSRGVVHRDIKPDNVLLSGRHPQVADFGVAKALSDAADAGQSTTAGLALGTPAYMAPEQAAADPHVDHRADIYSVGILGYELLTGRPPFKAASPQQVLSAQVSMDPEPVTKYRSGLQPVVAETIMRCLEKNPADRWQTADELLRQLEGATTPSSGALPTGRRVRRKRWPLMLAAGVVAIVAIVTRDLWLSSTPPVSIDPDAVAVIPFRTAAADPRLAYLREGIVDLFNARLTGSGGLRSVAPQTVINGWRRAGGSEDVDISQTEAIALSQRLGAGQVILGSVVGAGNAVELSASLYAVPRGTVLADARVTGSQDSITTMVDDLAALLLAQQGGETDQRLATLMSPSLPALRAYLDGRSDYRHGRYLSALVHYRRALQIDSTFALAALEAVFANDWAFLPDGWNPREIAIRLRGRLSARDQALLDAGLGAYGGVTHERRIARWNRATALAPDRPEVWYGLGDVWYHWGDMIGVADSRQRAAGRFRRALELDSTFAGAIEHLLEMAATDGDTAEVRRLNTLYFAADSAGDHAGFMQWRTAMALGDEATLANVRSRMPTLDPGDLSRILGIAIVEGIGAQDIEAVSTELRHRDGTAQERLARQAWAARGATALGHLATADSIVFEEFLPLEASIYGGQDRRQYTFDLYLDFIGVGDSATAAHAEVVMRAQPLTNVADEGSWYLWIEDRCLVGLWYARRSQPERAAAMLELVTERSSVAVMSFGGEVPVDLALCTSILSAVVAADTGGAALTTAIAELDAVIRTGLAQTRDWEPEAILVLAQLQAGQGRTAEALATVRRRPYWWNAQHQTLPTYLRTEGTLATQVGDTAGAVRAYQHYLALRSGADPVLQPEVEEVRAELAGLLGEP